MATQTMPDTGATQDIFPINGTDYIEFYVGNAKQASHYYRAAFGFNLVAYRGPETGTRDRASYVLQQDKIRFVLTTPILPESSDEARVIGGGEAIGGTSRDGGRGHGLGQQESGVEVQVPRGVPVWLDLHTGLGDVTQRIDPVGPPEQGQEHLSVSVRSGTGDIVITH